MGQPNRGAIDGQQAESAPSLWVEVRIEKVVEPVIDFNKCLKSEFQPSLAQGGLGNGALGNVGFIKSFEKAVQFVLIRTTKEVDQEYNQGLEWQLSIPGKVSRTKSVA